MFPSRPIVLAIIDGWGVASLDNKGNAIAMADPKNFNKFVEEYPAMSLYSSGIDVGLLQNETGNPQIGHLNLGAGQICYDLLPQIDQAISSGQFFNNTAFVQSIIRAKEKKTALHIIGLLSEAKVYSSIDHCLALLELSKKHGIKKVFIHLILDGIDVVNTASLRLISEFEEKIKNIGIGKIASLSGCNYAMDIDNHWDRTEKVYLAIAKGIADEYFTSAERAVDGIYSQQIFDEWFTPSVIRRGEKPVGSIYPGDSLIFFNFNPVGMRQLVKAFALPGFSKFNREYIEDLFVVTMSEYEKNLPVISAFPARAIYNGLAEIISKQNLSQIHISNIKRYSEVTYFFDGRIDVPFEKEKWELVRWGSVDNLTKRVLQVVDEGNYNFIVVNYPNVGISALSGNVENTVNSILDIDEAIGKLADQTLAKNGILVITSSYGHAEDMFDQLTGKIRNYYTSNPVPFLVIGNEFRGYAGLHGDAKSGDLSFIKPIGRLSDVAPTILKLLNIKKPEEMTGKSLF